MTEIEFQTQMNRLAATYGKGAYGDERVRLIWGAVKNQTNEWMRTTVDHFIATLRQAPLVPDFSEELSSGVGKSDRYCGSCMSGWVLGPCNTPDANTAMRCDCQGGVQVLVDRIRSHPESPDPDLARAIEQEFAGMSTWEWAKYGSGYKRQ